MHEEITMAEYSFCESVHAGPQSRWHIRKLSDKGKKLGGGIDTPTLCGKNMDGWDVNVAIAGSNLSHCCVECRAVYQGKS
jgi:hypothetical protein